MQHERQRSRGTRLAAGLHLSSIRRKSPLAQPCPRRPTARLIHATPLHDLALVSRVGRVPVFFLPSRDHPLD